MQVIRAHDKTPQQPKASRPTGRTWEETVPLAEQFRGECWCCRTVGNIHICEGLNLCVDPDACCWRVAKGKR